MILFVLRGQGVAGQAWSYPQHMKTGGVYVCVASDAYRSLPLFSIKKLGNLLHHHITGLSKMYFTGTFSHEIGVKVLTVVAMTGLI